MRLNVGGGAARVDRWHRRVLGVLRLRVGLLRRVALLRRGVALHGDRVVDSAGARHVDDRLFALQALVVHQTAAAARAQAAKGRRKDRNDEADASAHQAAAVDVRIAGAVARGAAGHSKHGQEEDHHHQTAQQVEAQHDGVGEGPAAFFGGESQNAKDGSQEAEHRGAVVNAADVGGVCNARQPKKKGQKSKVKCCRN